MEGRNLLRVLKEHIYGHNGMVVVVLSDRQVRNHWNLTLQTYRVSCCRYINWPRQLVLSRLKRPLTRTQISSIQLIHQKQLNRPKRMNILEINSMQPVS